MARPIKKGIDYFPLDVNFLSDIKVRKVMRAYGTKAIAILISLLSSIYREEGYYVVWDDDLAFLVADELGISEGIVSDVISKATEVGLFDKRMADKEKILTSKGIQDRYKKAAYQKKNNEIAKQYDLLSKSCDKPRNKDQNNGDNSVNHADSTQSKEKESKGNKSKDNNMSNQLLEQDFELLWNLYPRKEGKQKAFTAYKQAIRKGTTNKEIQDGIVAYTKQIEVKETPREFIKQGSTFFNGKCWNDEFDYTPKIASTFNQPVRQETIPDNIANPIPEQKLSAERQAELKRQLEELGEA